VRRADVHLAVYFYVVAATNTFFVLKHDIVTPVGYNSGGYTT
jgi:hypothetical protein